MPRVFRRVLRQFGDRLRYGFMLPVNLLLEGVVDHAIYHEPGIRSWQHWTLFREQDGLWWVRAVLMVSGFPVWLTNLPEKLATLYGDFGVELLVLTTEMINAGHLQTGEFARQVKQAVFPQDGNPPQRPHRSFRSLPPDGIRSCPRTTRRGGNPRGFV